MSAEARLGTSGVLEAHQRKASAGSILELQLASGMIPWVAGGGADPWNHLEAAMAIAVTGELAAARRALGWLAALQRPDGAWHAAYGPDGTLAEARIDTNGSAYFATALWALYLASGDLRLLAEHWPVARSGLGFVRSQQRPSGEVCWSGAGPGEEGDFALVAAGSSVHASLLAGAACAAVLGEESERRELRAAAGRLRVALTWRRAGFLPKDEYAMDWYYPVLAGVLAGAAGRRRIAAGWQRFVRPGRGVLCRSDQRWVTTAETAECAIACLRCGLGALGAELVSWTAAQRQDDGCYLTGLVYPERSPYPGGEVTSYSAAAVLLAADALAGGPARAVLAGGAPEPASAADRRPEAGRRCAAAGEGLEADGGAADALS